jgi:hypothetical protein
MSEKNCAFFRSFSGRTMRKIKRSATRRRAHVWTAPAVQEESDISAKRSGAVMYSACFRAKDDPSSDAAALAAGPDVIR